jgi:Calcineurin-like phosphoesterase
MRLSPIRPTTKPLRWIAGSTALLLAIVLSASNGVHAATPLFSDGFESGNLNAWSQSKGLVAQGAVVATGSWAGRATTVASAGYASASLAVPTDDVTLTAQVDLLSSSSTVTLLRLRSATGAGGIVSLKTNKAGKLLVRNEVTAINDTGATVLSKSSWHTVALHAAIAGASSTIEVWLDGGLLADLSGTTSLGTNTIGRLVIGTMGSVTADVAFDDVAATSASGPPPPPVVTAAGDICNIDPTSCAGTASLVLALDPDVAIALGDNAYSSGTLAQYLASYDLEWGQFKSRTKPTPGNHEWMTANAQGYRDYFGPSVQPNGNTWYSYDVGAWHLISLDSDCSSIGGCGPGAPAYNWLQQDLAANTDACTLAYWHHPLFTSGAVHTGTTEIKSYWDLLQADGAEIVLNGHSHNYERFAPQTSGGTASATGIREFVVGTGGSGAHAFSTTIQPNSQVRLTKVKGVIELTLSDGGYAWRFVKVGGSVLDSGTGACH